jgi:multidrug efflux system membrane fusion protein
VPSRTIADDTVVDKGLRAGETIVTDGQINLIPGATVEAKNSIAESADKPAAPPDQRAGSAVRAADAADPPAGKTNLPKTP